MKRIGIFVDGSNLYMSSKALDFSVDYVKLLDMYKEQGEVVKAVYFTALPPKTEHSTLRTMIDFISYHGWTIVQKETRKYRTPAGEEKMKGNMDVDIAVHVGEAAPFITHLVLYSGDGDFRVLLESVQRRHGIHCTVVSARSLVADALRRQADEFQDLSVLKPKLTHEKETSEHSAVRERRSKFWNGEGQ